jgi:L-amino acid N-acyltransferase YncA
MIGHLPLVIGVANYSDGGLPAERADVFAQEAADLVNKALGTEPHNAFQPEKGDSLVYAVDEGVIVAMVVWRPSWDTSAFVGLAFTVEAHRRRGLYRQLLVEASRQAAFRGLRDLTLGVFTSNIVSLAAHDALGFRRYAADEEAVCFTRPVTMSEAHASI